MKTEITELLGIEYPVIQGGMAWVAECHLAAAVSNAGGLGLIAAGGAPAEWVREQIRETKKLTDKPFGGNCVCISGIRYRHGSGPDSGSSDSVSLVSSHGHA